MFVVQGSKKLFITLGFPARLGEKAFALLGYGHGLGTEVWMVHDGKQTITRPLLGSPPSPPGLGWALQTLALL